VDDGLYPVVGSVLNGISGSFRFGEDFWLRRPPSPASVLTPGGRRLQPFASPRPLAGLRLTEAAGPHWAAMRATRRGEKGSPAGLSRWVG
jgi:hypothetical protein